MTSSDKLKEVQQKGYATVHQNNVARFIKHVNSNFTKDGMFLTDLDGTFLDGKSQITQQNSRALRKLKRAGTIFGPITGRTLEEAIQLTKEVHQHTTLIVADNGSTICWMYRGEVVDLVNFVIPEQVAEGILGLYLELGGNMNDVVITTDRSYVLSEGFTDYQRDALYSKPTVKNNNWKEEIKSTRGIKTLMVTSLAVKESLDIFCEHVRNLGINVSHHDGTTFIEVSHKHIAIGILSDILEIPMDYVAAVGDGANDIPMLNEVGQPYLMKNAKNYVREKVSQYTPLTKTNEESGVAEAVKIFLDELYSRVIREELQLEGNEDNEENELPELN